MDNIVVLTHMTTNLVLFLHRLGIKAYQVESESNISELVDISSIDIKEILSGLSNLSDSTARLLISDTISYLFHCQIAHGPVPLNREIILENIKDAPAEFSTSNWDYKVVSDTDSFTEVLVYAPIPEFQSIINTIAKELQIKFNVIEPESIAVTRHPNPIIGVMQKEGLSKKDSPTPEIIKQESIPQESSNILKVILYFIFILVFIGVNFFLYREYEKSSPTKDVDNLTPTPTVSVVTPSVKPTGSDQIKVADFQLSIQNGSGKSGYAASIAEKFKDIGFLDIKTGNADRSDYSQSKIIFKSETAKDQYSTKITSVFPVTSDNISVNKDQSYDAILILGSL